MKDHHSVIDYNNNTIKIDHIILPFKEDYIQNNIEYANKIILSARSETIAEVKLSNCLLLGIIINQEIQRNVLIPNTLVNNNNQKAYIPILNLSHNEIIIDKPTFELAEIIPEEIVNLTQVQPTKRGTLLNNNLRLNHLSKEEKESIIQICQHYSDLFYLPENANEQNDSDMDIDYDPSLDVPGPSNRQ
ncbi:hypothetical protein HHI36_001685 [Cryptolaemus montrouzieri]|uniref:Uncharacterized protein n=1 Tax=Cryptolaemus montrouzieri TaxID=559131 RepID=A0ABD2P8C1_9CUCU